MDKVQLPCWCNREIIHDRAANHKAVLSSTSSFSNLQNEGSKDHVTPIACDTRSVERARGACSDEILLQMHGLDPKILEADSRGEARYAFVASISVSL